jgi:L-alanine-DL-glutamate epimerase-like enolase superfamily enzyme
MADDPTVASLRVSAYRIPTDLPESDGTYRWNATDIVIVEIAAGGCTGLGYTYGHPCIAPLIRDHFTDLLLRRSALDIAAAHSALLASLRNAGRPGIGAMAVAAVDIALWDLKARLLEIPLADLLGRAREAVPVYASGGFTSYDARRLGAQLAGWAEQGFSSAKIKIARHPEQDEERLRAARDALGPAIELLVDANGAYRRKQALAWMERLRDYGVTWLEEPVSSDDPAGLHLLRDRAPPGLEVAAGEYGYEPAYFLRLLEAGAVDVLQADATRCGGISGFLAAGALCDAAGIDLSSHTAPAAHLHAACALPALRHMEWFHDHARIEALLFDGAAAPVAGRLAPDPARPGHGLTFKRQDAAAYAV